MKQDKQSLDGKILVGKHAEKNSKLVIMLEEWSNEGGGVWTVIFRPVFEKWFYEQSEDLQEKLLETIGLLRLNGPTLGRPYADTIKGSS